MSIPLGWRTDLAVLRLGGSVIEEHGDHLVVRTPAAPTYHWGHFLLVTDDSAVADADRWLARFEEEFPGAAHRAVGLGAEPDDPSGWLAHGLQVEHEDVLERDRPVEPAPAPPGYVVRPLQSQDDWAQSTRMRVAAGHDVVFEREMTAARQTMVRAGHTRWFGAFRDAELAAELGIVDCGPGPDGRLGRFQSVLTAHEHRRKGLTSHLLVVAAGWAGDRGCDRLVIVADEGTDANRLYRARGFAPTARSAQVYRAPLPGDAGPE